MSIGMRAERNYVEKRRVSNRYGFKAMNNREEDAMLGTIGKGDVIQLISKTR